MILGKRGIANGAVKLEIFVESGIDDGFSPRVSCVRFSPNAMNPVIVSCGWDKVVKVSSVPFDYPSFFARAHTRFARQVWELSKCKLKTNHFGHTGYINTISVSPDGSLAASGGKDGITMLWDLNDGKHLYSLEAGDVVNALVFSPNRYWLCAATASCVKIFDLESKYVSCRGGCRIANIGFWQNI